MAVNENFMDTEFDDCVQANQCPHPTAWMNVPKQVRGGGREGRWEAKRAARGSGDEVEVSFPRFGARGCVVLWIF